MTDDEIKAYWQKNESQDKAGGYSIQGVGRPVVKELQGDFDNIIGWPVTEVKKVSAKFKFPLTK